MSLMAWSCHSFPSLASIRAICPHLIDGDTETSVYILRSVTGRALGNPDLCWLRPAVHQLCALGQVLCFSESVFSSAKSESCPCWGQQGLYMMFLAYLHVQILLGRGKQPVLGVRVW